MFITKVRESKMGTTRPSQKKISPTLYEHSTQSYEVSYDLFGASVN